MKPKGTGEAGTEAPPLGLASHPGPGRLKAGQLRSRTAVPDGSELKCALYGGPGCPNGAAGDGSVAKAAETALSSDQAATSNLQAQVNELRTQELAAEDRAVTAADQNQQGLLSRLDALDQLADHDAFIAAARLLLFILFVPIGCTPLIVRAVKVYGSHDADEKILRAQELADMQLASQHELARELIAAQARVERAKLLAWQEEQLLAIAKGKNHGPGEDGYDTGPPTVLPPPSAAER